MARGPSAPCGKLAAGAGRCGAGRAARLGRAEGARCADSRADHPRGGGHSREHAGLVVHIVRRCTHGARIRLGARVTSGSP